MAGTVAAIALGVPAAIMALGWKAFDDNNVAEETPRTSYPDDYRSVHLAETKIEAPQARQASRTAWGDPSPQTGGFGTGQMLGASRIDESVYNIDTRPKDLPLVNRGEYVNPYTKQRFARFDNDPPPANGNYAHLGSDRHLERTGVAPMPQNRVDHRTDQFNMFMEPTAARYMSNSGSRDRVRTIAAEDTRTNRNDMSLHGLRPESTWSRTERPHGYDGWNPSNASRREMENTIQERYRDTERGNIDDEYAGRSWLNEQMLPGRAHGHGARPQDVGAFEGMISDLRETPAAPGPARRVGFAPLPNKESRVRRGNPTQNHTHATGAIPISGSRVDPQEIVMSNDRSIRGAPMATQKRTNATKHNPRGEMTVRRKARVRSGPVKGGSAVRYHASTVQQQALKSRRRQPEQPVPRTRGAAAKHRVVNLGARSEPRRRAGEEKMPLGRHAAARPKDGRPVAPAKHHLKRRQEGLNPAMNGDVRTHQTQQRPAVLDTKDTATEIPVARHTVSHSIQDVRAAQDFAPSKPEVKKQPMVLPADVVIPTANPTVDPSALLEARKADQPEIQVSGRGMQGTTASELSTQRPTDVPTSNTKADKDLGAFTAGGVAAHSAREMIPVMDGPMRETDTLFETASSNNFQRVH